MLAYHFTNDKLRDGRPIPPIGETLVHGGALKMCETGLHASLHPSDALIYAPGNVLHLVLCGGTIIHERDKLVCSERTILSSVDMEPHLRAFARKQALSVAHLWDVPKIVREYLATGDDDKRYAARAAAWDAARGGARGAAWTAARGAAWTAASDAAWTAARDAAWTAAFAAAWTAASDAGFAAAWAAARDDFKQLVDAYLPKEDFE